MHKSKGLSGAVTDPQDLYRAVKACGSHYFDKDTRRFFGSRVISVYPVPGKRMTYFVETVGGPNTPIARTYRVGVFKGCKVKALGKGEAALAKGYKTSRQANAVAAKIAAKANR